MSKVTDAKKRKGAPEPAVAAKKTKITRSDAAPVKSSAVDKKTASRTIVKGAPDAVSVKQTKKPRTRAEDLNEAPVEVSAVEEKTEVAPTKAKTTKKAAAPKTTDTNAVKATKTETKEKKTATAASKPAKAATKPAAKAAPVADDFGGFSDEDDVEDEKEDDQTAALLAGFESSEDENDPQEDEAGIALTKIPPIPNKKEMKKQLLATQTTDDENSPGTIYVGRIPHGFFEHQMRAYFSQFGDITHLRLSRNKLTGKSKHYAFIEFASAAVAEIVAKTMDKYLMFGHILQVRRIPDEQVHADMWKAEGKRFKAMPRNKIEGGMLRRGATRDQWAKRVKGENQRRSKNAKKLKEMGYDFEMPDVKSVADVPVKDVDGDKEGLVITAEDDNEETTAVKQIKDTPEEKVTKVTTKTTDGAVVEEVTAVKRKKTGKAPAKAKKARTSI